MTREANSKVSSGMDKKKTGCSRAVYAAGTTGW